MIVNQGGGMRLPKLDNPGSPADLLAGKQLVDQYGRALTGTMPGRSAGDLEVRGAEIIVPAGYYPERTYGRVAEAAQAVPEISVDPDGLITARAQQEAGYVAAGTRSAQRQLDARGAGDLEVREAEVIVPAGYYPERVSGHVAEAAQAVPEISVGPDGLITARAGQEAGYVAAGIRSAQRQLYTQGAATITPGETEQTAVEAGRFTTGEVKVAAVKTAQLPVPEISVDAEGWITATSDLKSGGFIAAGAKSAVLQLPTRGAADLTASGAEVNVPAGYYPSGVSRRIETAGLPQVALSIDSAGLIRADAYQLSSGYVTADNQAPKATQTRQLTTVGKTTVTPGTAAKTAVAAGRYTTGAVTVAGDANLAAGNIRKGVSIFGVAGSYAGGEGMEVLSTGTVYGTGSNVLSFSPESFALHYQKMKALYLTSNLYNDAAAALGNSKRWIKDMLYIFSGKNAVLLISGVLFIVNNNGTVSTGIERERPDAENRYSAVSWTTTKITINQYSLEGFVNSPSYPYTYYVMG